MRVTASSMRTNQEPPPVSTSFPPAEDDGDRAQDEELPSEEAALAAQSAAVPTPRRTRRRVQTAAVPAADPRQLEVPNTNEHNAEPTATDSPAEPPQAAQPRRRGRPPKSEVKSFRTNVSASISVTQEAVLDEVELASLGRLTRLAMKFDMPVAEMAEAVRGMLAAYDKAKGVTTTTWVPPDALLEDAK